MTSERRRLEHVAGRLRLNDLAGEIREDVLREEDGPMFLRRRDLQPDREFLVERYEIFRKAV